MIYKFFDKKFYGSSNNNEIKQNEQLPDNLPIIKKFKKEKYIRHLKTIWYICMVCSFKNIFVDSERKPNKMSVDKGGS